MTGPGERSARTLPIWLVLVVAVVGIAAVAGAAAYALQANDHLTAARGTVAARDADLASATETLSSAESALAAAQAEQAAAVKAHDDATARQTAAKAIVADQTACIVAQQTDLVTLREISDRVTDNFNKTSEDSAFAKAGKARLADLNAADTAYYDASVAKNRGQTSVANAKLASARSHEAKAAAQRTIMRRTLADVDATAKKIEADLTALEAQLAKTASSCGLVA